MEICSFNFYAVYNIFGNCSVCTENELLNLENNLSSHSLANPSFLKLDLKPDIYFSSGYPTKKKYVS